MKTRWNVFELEDFAWFPAWLRDPATDYLKFLADATGSYGPAISPLATLLIASRQNQILDLCSGGGGGLLSIFLAVEKAVGHSLSAVLTDKFPNHDAAQKKFPRVSYSERSVDATEVHEDLAGVRTLFTSIHHFSPAAVRKIAVDAVRSGVPLAVFDATQRQWNVFFRIPLVAAGVWLATPFLRPFRFSRFFWTYGIPLIPLLVLFDGSMSCLRSYRAEELLEIVQPTADSNYRWLAFTRRRPGWLYGGDVTCLIGAPLSVDLGPIAESGKAV